MFINILLKFSAPLILFAQLSEVINCLEGSTSITGYIHERSEVDVPGLGIGG